MPQIKTLTIRFNNDLQPHEIPLFRGAIIAATNGDNVLYHNHQGDGFRYSYPLIQYKRINGRAAIFCIGSGTDSIGQLFANGNFNFTIGERTVEMELNNIQANKYNIQLWQNNFNYHISRWLPLNADNYRRYNNLKLLSERISLLENILTGNLLSMLKGLDIHIENQLTVNITNLDQPYIITYKGIKMTAINCSFISNLSIPQYAGIGKNASVGCGMVNHLNS